MAHIEKQEFKGKPVLSIKASADDTYGVSFGVRKAKLIVEAIEDIKKFVEENNQ